MTDFLDPLKIPKRISLSGQAADSIRKGIIEGTWQDYLPSERHLSELFQVSRPTIRTALRQLSKEGLLEIKPRCRNRLLPPPKSSDHKLARLVGFISHQPVEQVASFAHQSFSEMRTHLAEQGFTSMVFICPRDSRGNQDKKLEQFIRQNRVSCCVLLSGNLDIQQWFSEHAVPALVLGTCHPKVNLPSLDVDYHSVCRHAAGTFLGKGHRRMALLVLDSKMAGDIASVAGFTEAIAEHNAKHDKASATIIHHNGIARNISARLDTLFHSESPPTALLVAGPQYVFAVIIYLLKRGLSVPDTVSFISRDHHILLENVSPPISHYHFGMKSYNHQLSRMLTQLVSQGSLPSEPHLIFPEFSGNGTVKSIR